MSKAWQAYARHVLDAIEKIRKIETRGDLRQDEILYDAALRNLQTLSEATRLNPGRLKLDHPDTPWKAISGFRNILVHDYLGHIDPETVAGVVNNQLEPLRLAISEMLAVEESMGDRHQS